MCDLLHARTHTWISCFSCFLASAKRVAPLFWGLKKKVRPALRNAGRAFPQSGQVWGSLPRVLVSLASFLRASATGFAQRGSRLGILRPKKVRPGLRLRGSKKVDFLKVLRMGFSIVENVPTPCGIIFKLCTASQLPYRAKSKNWTKNIENPSFTVFPLLDHVGAIPY